MIMSLKNQLEVEPQHIHIFGFQYGEDGVGGGG